MLDPTLRGVLSDPTENAPVRGTSPTPCRCGDGNEGNPPGIVRPDTSFERVSQAIAGGKAISLPS
jgi:hypothetical protein